MCKLQTFYNLISWQVSGRETNPECVCDTKWQQQRSPRVDHLWSSRQRMGFAPILCSHPAFLDSGQMILVFNGGVHFHIAYMKIWFLNTFNFSGSALWLWAPECFIQSGANSKPRFLFLWNVWRSRKPAQKEEHGRLWLLWPTKQWSRPQQKLSNRFQPVWRPFGWQWPWVQSCEGHKRSLLWLLKYLRRKAAFLWARDKSSKRRLD